MTLQLGTSTNPVITKEQMHSYKYCKRKIGLNFWMTLDAEGIHENMFAEIVMNQDTILKHVQKNAKPVILNHTLPRITSRRKMEDG